MNVCSNCGLPKDLCVCETIAREKQRIEVTIERRKFGKKYTVVRGLGNEVDIEDVARKLKSKLACGGTSKENHIELQGDHKAKIRQVLAGLGFSPETIDVGEIG